MKTRPKEVTVGHMSTLKLISIGYLKIGDPHTHDVLKNIVGTFEHITSSMEVPWEGGGSNTN